MPSLYRQQEHAFSRIRKGVLQTLITAALSAGHTAYSGRRKYYRTKRRPSRSGAFIRKRRSRGLRGRNRVYRRKRYRRSYRRRFRRKRICY